MIDVRVCSECGNENIHVVDSRKNPDGIVRRRMECLDCGHRYATYEIHGDDFRNCKTMLGSMGSAPHVSSMIKERFNNILRTANEDIIKLILDEFNIDLSK